ncbi:MAG: archease [Methanoregula sp.]|jgi:SHS2 domain-containing protein|nr:archease [Methanoregula sp.]
MSFVELSHTADVRIHVRAPTLDLLFSESFEALMQTIFGKDRRGGHSKEIRIAAADTETLLMDFLSESLFICEVEGLVFTGASVVTDGKSLTAVLDGEPFDRSRHAGGTEVKGISYSGLAITRDENDYMLDILFDV